MDFYSRPRRQRRAVWQTDMKVQGENVLFSGRIIILVRQTNKLNVFYRKTSVTFFLNLNLGNTQVFLERTAQGLCQSFAKAHFAIGKMQVMAFAVTGKQ